jgi:hypothetical protein
VVRRGREGGAPADHPGTAGADSPPNPASQSSAHVGPVSRRIALVIDYCQLPNPDTPCSHAFPADYSLLLPLLPLLLLLSSHLPLDHLFHCSLVSHLPRSSFSDSPAPVCSRPVFIASRRITSHRIASASPLSLLQPGYRTVPQLYPAVSLCCE